jgi:hypothetical protein
MFRQWRKFHRFFKEKPAIHIPIWLKREHVNAYRCGRWQIWHFMNAVDTGWVTDEDPAELAKMKRTTRLSAHVDIVDGRLE